MTQPKPCVFCGQVRKLSREHVIAQHWRQLHGPERGTQSHSGFSTDPATGKIKRHKGQKEAKHFDLKSTGVCVVCNNTWMSRLEHSVKGIIGSIAEPKVNSQTIVLPNPALRRVLRRWAAKTAIVIERAHEGEVLTPPELIQGVLSDGDLPYFHGWINRLEPHEAWRVSTRHGVIVTREGDVNFRTCLFSIHRCLVITVHSGNQFSDDFLGAHGLRAFFGEEIHDARMLPWGNPFPGPEVAWIKDKLDERLRSEYLSTLVHRVDAADDVERARLEGWMREAAARAAERDALSGDS